MKWEKALKSGRRFASQLSKEEITILYKICIGLKPRKSQTQSKEEWFQHSSRHHIHYKIFNNLFKNEFKVMKKFNENATKKIIVKATAQALRERQQKLGLEGSLMNSVYIGLINTMRRYFDNPRLYQ